MAKRAAYPIPAIALLSLWTAPAQTPSAPPTFEVASIKLSAPPSPGPRIEPDRFTDTCPLTCLVSLAYELRTYDRVSGGPDWAQSEYYDVAAKADASSNPHQIRLMLQTLLTDRFHLKLCHEAKTIKGYALVVGNSGAKLPPPKSDLPPGFRGVAQLGDGFVRLRAATMGNFASALSTKLGLPVVDDTRIEGNYEIELRFDENTAQLAPPDLSGEAAASEPSTSIFTAVRSLGLKLESRQVPVEYIVIENAERPTPN